MKPSEADLAGDGADKPRLQSFTPHWNDAILKSDALPVKLGAKVVRVLKDDPVIQIKDDEDQISSDNEVIKDEHEGIKRISIRIRHQDDIFRGAIC
jgi:hypothetical protein